MIGRLNLRSSTLRHNNCTTGSTDNNPARNKCCSGTPACTKSQRNTLQRIHRVKRQSIRRTEVRAWMALREVCS